MENGNMFGKVSSPTHFLNVGCTTYCDIWKNVHSKSVMIFEDIWVFIVAQIASSMSVKVQKCQVATHSIVY